MHLCILFWTDFETKELITGCQPSEIKPDRHWCPTNIRYKEFVRDEDVTGYCSPDCPLHSAERRSQLLLGPPESLPGRDLQAEANCHTVDGEKCVLPWLFTGMQEVIYGCLLDEADGRYWCPTDTDASRRFSPTSMMWGFCQADCPIHVRGSPGSQVDVSEFEESETGGFFDWDGR